MPSFVVSTAFKGKDGISSAFKNMSKNADKFGSRAGKAFSKASRSASRFKDIVKGVLTANVLTRGTMLLKQGMQSVAEEFVNFDQSITSAGAKFPIAVDRGTAAFDRLKEAAREVGAKTQFTATQAAAALEKMAMAGMDNVQAMAALPGVTDLATASNMEIVRATDIATDALGAFDLMAKDDIKLKTNLTRINDVFAKTLTSANLDMEQLVGTLEQSSSSAKIASVGLETYGALLKPMADKFIKGTKAGTTLKNVFLRLASPPTEAAKALDKLKIATSDKSGKMRDMIDIFEELRIKTGKLGEAQRAQALDAIFGKRAIEGATRIMDAGSEKLNEYRDNLLNAGGAAEEMANKMRKGLMNRLLTLKSSLIEVGFKIIDAFEDKFPGALDTATSAVQNFNVTPIIEGIKTAVGFMEGLYKWAKKLSPIIAGLVTAFIFYKVALVAVAAVQAVQFFFATALAIKAAAGAMGLLNAVFIASPIGLIAVAVGLLVAGAVWLYKNWDKVKAAFQRFYEYVSPKIGAIINIIDELLENPFFVAAALLIAPWITGALLVVKHWDKVKILFETLSGVHSEMVLIVADGIEFLANKFISIKDTIVDFVDTTWNKLSELLENPFFTVPATIMAPWLTIPASIIKYWEPIKEFFTELLRMMGKAAGFIGEKGSGFGDLVGQFGEFIGVTGNSAFDDLADINKNYNLATDGNRAGPVAPTPEAPNKTEVEVNQKSQWYGQLDIAGAPKGSVFEQNKTKNAPKINVEMLGENP